MGTAENSSSKPASHWAAVLLGAWSYALYAAVLRIAVHAVSPFANSGSYRLGCMLGIGIDLLLGLLVGVACTIPSAFVRSVVAGSIAAVLLGSVAAGAHYHAIFNRLPTASTLANLGYFSALQSSVNEHAPLWLLGLECLLPAAAIGWGVPKLAAWASRRWLDSKWLRALAGVSSACVVASVLGLRFTTGQAHYGTVGALGHLLLAKEPGALLPTPSSTPQSGDALGLVQTRLAVENAGPPRDVNYPYCGPLSAPMERTAARSAILLILEGVDERLFDGSFQGKPLMPNLQRLAQRGVHFDHFYAPGYESNQAMPALFSGLPAISYRNLLQHAPLARLHGFPSDLRGAGFATAYFHGADLSFEQQRAFLTEVGFETVVEPNPLDRQPTYGWGQPDGVVLDEVRAWITSERTQSAERPYFATAFTLSTHDPYVWPPEHARRFEGDDVYARLAETLSYLDDEIARFYAWYEREELLKGTVLAITGDHAPRIPAPGDPADTTTGELEYRFRVPLLLWGLSEQERAHSARARPAGHHDVPQTLLGLVGVAGFNCYQGRNLLGPEAPPENRWVISVAGESLEFLYVHAAERRWMLSLKDDTLVGFDAFKDPLFRTPLAASSAEVDAVREFAQAYLGLNRTLVEGDRFTPPERSRPARPMLGHVEQPMLIAHAGRSLGAEGPPPNGMAAFDAAIAAGFRWIEMDLQLTKDSVPVLSHDPETPLEDGSQLEISQHTLSEINRAPLVHPLVTFQSVVARFAGKVGLCVELKRHKDIFQTLDLARETLKILAPLPPTAHVVIDSFSHTQLATPKRFSAWPVGYDLPQKAVDVSWLDFAADRGLDWVYVEQSFVTPEVIQRAHALGLKVMMYTVNDPSRLDALGNELPDGIQSDVAAPWKSWRGRNWLSASTP